MRKQGVGLAAESSTFIKLVRVMKGRFPSNLVPFTLAILPIC